MTKKHAVIFFGQIRGNLQTWKSVIDNIIEPNNADVFVHTWAYKHDKLYVKNCSDFLYNDFVENEIKNVYLGRQNQSSSKYAEFISTFLPKKLLIEEQVIFDNDFLMNKNKIALYDAANFQNIRSQSYSRQKGVQIMKNYENENNFKYDYIYQIRSDILVTKKICCNNPNFHYFPINEYVIDTFVYGGRDSLVFMSDFHDHAIELYKKYTALNYSHNEWFMYKFLVENQIPVTHIEPFTDIQNFGDRGIIR